MNRRQCNHLQFCSSRKMMTCTGTSITLSAPRRVDTTQKYWFRSQIKGFRELLCMIEQ